MQKLTKAQEEIMHLIWELGECTVGDLREAIAEREGKKPAHSTVSTLVLALDKRGFLTHRQYGRTYVYEPVISREEYGQRSLGQLIKKFFGGSPQLAVSHLVESEDLSLDELNDLVRKLEDNED
ncbi:BlaI/MecI/CopY family transcriptional regulator [Lewinella sp. W8]|uniref:BlaI/MecI/CopY family transcriptional regulator n=1 Tax=Lewinella sp. W8 TaxID=2528208 RepID=UPI0010689BC6|nr:BlaI/MecI/CopY family transcriptional regulator [Lewinella sp. W8]MTB51572.1 BlaI/MecI/CopY family transcriptional regulator [Lewinella sp. W8]